MKLVIVWGLVFLAVAATAQTKMKRPASVKAASTTNTSSTSLSTASYGNAWYSNHVSVGAVLSNASDLTGIDVSGYNGGTATGRVDLRSDNPFGIQAEYKRDMIPAVSWFTNLSVYKNRDLSSVKGTVSGERTNGLFTSPPSYQPWILAAGAQYNFNDFVYFPAAVNYTALNFTKNGFFDDMSMSPRLGFQLGIGGVIEKTVAIELEYQSVRYAFDARQGHLKFNGEVHNDGLNLQGRYTF